MSGCPKNPQAIKEQMLNIASESGPIKNIDKSTVLMLADIVAARPGEVVSKTLVQNKHVSMTLFAFDDGEEISSHSAKGDAFVYCLEGEGSIVLCDERMTLLAGESLVMPLGAPHSVHGVSGFKMLLVVVYPATA